MLHSFPTRRSSDLVPTKPVPPVTRIFIRNFCSSGSASALSAPGTSSRAHPSRRARRLEVPGAERADARSEEHTSELQSRFDPVCRLLLEKKKKKKHNETQNKKLNKNISQNTPLTNS